MDNQSESAIEKKQIELLASRDYQRNPEIIRKAKFIANLSIIIGTRKNYENLRDKSMIKCDNRENLHLELFNTKEWSKYTFQTSPLIRMETFNQILHYRIVMKECVLG